MIELIHEDCYPLLQTNKQTQNTERLCNLFMVTELIKFRVKMQAQAVSFQNLCALNHTNIFLKVQYFFFFFSFF